MAQSIPDSPPHGVGHRENSSGRIHMERACQLHGMKMTRHGLLHKGFNISLLSLMGMYIHFFVTIRTT